MKAEAFLVQANHAVPQTITCGITDQLLKNLSVPVGFFFEKSVDRNLLISALKEVLSDFPIFAGTLKTIQDDLCIDCNNQGVLFSVAKEDCTISQILAALPRLKRERLINPLHPRKVIADQSPVMTIQLTYFSCGGMVMGICWHHAIGDMHTFMQLMKAWSNVVNQQEYLLPLIYQERDQYLQEKLDKNNNAIPSVRYVSIPEYLGLVFFLLLRTRDKSNLHFYFSENELNNMKQDFLEKTDKKLSKNDVLCAHLFSLFSELDGGNKPGCLSVVINYRSRVNLPPNVLGNFVSNINLLTGQRVNPFRLAQDLRASIDNFRWMHMDFFVTANYIKEHGGIKKIHRFLNKGIDPCRRTLLVTNWASFGIYDVMFREAKPFYFSYFGDPPLPWLSSINEGFSNHGLIYNVALPSKLAKKLMQADNLQKIHRYREQNEAMPDLVEKLEWLL